MAAEFDGVPVEAIRERPVPSLSSDSFAPTGGTRVTRQDVLGLRTRLDTIADSAGWPRDSLQGRQQFDRHALAALGAESFPVSEMLRSDTWAWLATILVPHLVIWRFGGTQGTTKPERFAGIIQRNALGRLWLRAWTLDPGTGTQDRWSLAQGLSEDAAVAIIERPSLCADHRLARTIAECWLGLKSRGVADSEGLLRDAAKRIRIKASICELGILDDASLQDAVNASFNDSVSARPGRAFHEGA